MDLVFPMLYGAALLVSFLSLWAMLERTFSPAPFVGVLAVTVLADWTENLVQLAQLERHFVTDGPELQTRWIEIASAATVVKLASFALAFLGIATLVVVALTRAARSA